MAKRKTKTLVEIFARVVTHLEERLSKRKINQVEFRDSINMIRSHIVCKSALNQEQEAEIAKGKAIKDKIAKGEKVLTLKTLVGTGEKKDDFKIERVNSPVEQKRIASKWSDRTEGVVGSILRFDLTKDYPNSPFADLFEKVETKPLPATTETGFFCTFCHKPVDYSRATVGKKTRILVLPTVVMEDDELTIEDKVSSKTTNVIACPDCSLKVKPKEQRWVNPESL